MAAFTPPPPSKSVLLARVHALAGLKLGEVATQARIALPQDPRRAKGWGGLVLEQVLGATASSHALPDFPELGVEMKSIPISPDGRVRESTYVATAPLNGTLESTWEEAWVRRKLRCVLWVPLVVSPGAGVADRIVGTAVLWEPSPEEDAILEADWREIAAHLALGHLDQLHARHGRALQLRPKAANAAARTWTLDEDGRAVRENPRGFYLRPSFTSAILAQSLRLPGH